MQTALQLSDMLAHRKHASLRPGKQSHVVVVGGGCLLFVVCCLLFHGNEALVGAQQHWTERC